MGDHRGSFRARPHPVRWELAEGSDLGQGILRAPPIRSGRGTSVTLASYARDGQAERDLCVSVHSTVLADVEQQVMALRALHAKPRDLEGGENFGGVVARSRPA